MLSVSTRYVPSNGVRGPRIRVMVDNREETLDWEDGLSSEENHHAAARKVITARGWEPGGRLIGIKWSFGSHAFGNVYVANFPDNLYTLSFEETK